MKSGYELLLPEGILEYFEVKEVSDFKESIVLHLEEKNIIPEEYQGLRIYSKGFSAPSQIHDFPIRGKSLILQVRRRYWQNKDTGDLVIRNWSMVAKGTRLTAEFAAFLKELSRHNSD